MEKQNIVYPPEFFIKGMRVKIISNGFNFKEAIFEKQISDETAQIWQNGHTHWIYFKDIQPILPKLSFIHEMRKAVLAGRKTQTSRALFSKKGKPARRFEVGDILGIGEAWRQNAKGIAEEFVLMYKGGDGIVQTDFRKFHLPNCPDEMFSWNMCATLPTWAVRNLIQITGVYEKCPCDFDYFECINEGIEEIKMNGDGLNGNAVWVQYSFGSETLHKSAYSAWQALLKKVCGKDFETFWNNPALVYKFKLI